VGRLAHAFIGKSVPAPGTGLIERISLSIGVAAPSECDRHVRCDPSIVTTSSSHS